MDSPLETTDDTRRQRVLILTARAAEHNSGLPAHDFEKHLHQNHPYYRLEGDEWDIRLTHTGIGPDRTRSTLGQLEGTLDPDFVLITGTAGSLSQDLERDSVYLPTAVRALRATDQTDWFHPETRILHWLKGTLEETSDRELQFRSGPLLTASKPVVDPDNRRQLRTEHQALAVDMESSTVLTHFIERLEDQPAWGVLRVVSDTPEDTDLDQVKEHQSVSAQLNASLLECLVDHLLHA